jgi:DMSO/TMAO reductase YedYZ molybdopterin-dependent catalytic subunit
MTRRSFAVGAAAAAAGGGWYWLTTRGSGGTGIPWPLRRVLEANERVARAYYSPARLAPTFPAGRAEEPRVNGSVGLLASVDPAQWRLRVLDPARGDLVRELTLDALAGLERVEMVTELKCVEGWSTVVRWGGVRLSDFAAKFGLATRSGRPPDPKARPDDLYPYLALRSIDNQYNVGLDVESALHPQTLLCDTMAGQPLTPAHGAPLRLVTPLKYGIKLIKQIGSLRFQDVRPNDYWADRGYDWYAGH